MAELEDALDLGSSVLGRAGSTPVLGTMPTIQEIWRQTDIPVVYRPTKTGALMVRLPYQEDNKRWLRAGRRSKPKWIAQKKYWELPRSWFSDLITRLLCDFGDTYLIQAHNELEVCAPACWSAQGFECNCSCLGAHHGEGMPGGRWYVVSDACAVTWHGRKLRWSLLTVESKE